MSCAKNARKLANYITELPQINQAFGVLNQFSYYHIGALFTDVTLQAGLNYNHVVKPRVQRVLLQYPEDHTVRKFQEIIAREGLSKVINWHHKVKLERFQRLIEFASVNEIDTCSDLKTYFFKKHSHNAFLCLNGFGPKSLDYLLKLLNIDTVAVDRHISSFVKMADINVKGYQETKRIVEFAADFLNMPRSSIDQFIWNFMNKKKYKISSGIMQNSIPFPIDNHLI